MTGKPLIDNILIAVTLVVSIATAGLFVYSEMLWKRSLPSDEEEVKQLLFLQKKTEAKVTVELDKIIVNLNNTRGRLRFLDVVIHLVPLKMRFLKKLEEKRFLINDAVIDVASSMKPNELNSVAGKILLESRIKKAINNRIGISYVKEVLFSRFVVQ